ncbi:MAG: hypothetical protein RJA70_2438 [Pseudomonadota bacterium]|jgi:hypothetical protein
MSMRARLPHPVTYRFLAVTLREVSLAATAFSGVSFAAVSAEANAEAEAAPPKRPAVSAQATEAGAELAARLGYAYFRHSRSIALEHTIKPALAIAAFWPLLPRLDWGASAHAVLASANYGVWAGYAIGRYRLLDADFRLAVTLGLGLGHDAPILHQSLKADGTLLPYAMLGAEALFTLNDQWRLGATLNQEQLSVFHLGAAANYRY